MNGAMDGERWMGVRAFTRELSLAVGRQVAASTVTRAVQNGKIPARAGAGGPEIPVAAGIEAYRRNTDPTKAMGPAVRDGTVYDLGGAVPGGPVAPVMPSRTPPAAPAGPDVNRIKTAQAAIQLQQAQLDLAERQGTLAHVEPLKAAFGRQLAGMVGQIEVALPDLAQQLAVQLSCEPHDVLVELRSWWRGLRVSMASTARAQGEALPDLAAAANDTSDAGDEPAMEAAE